MFLGHWCLCSFLWLNWIFRAVTIWVITFVNTISLRQRGEQTNFLSSTWSKGQITVLCNTKWNWRGFSRQKHLNGAQFINHSLYGCQSSNWNPSLVNFQWANSSQEPNLAWLHDLLNSCRSPGQCSSSPDPALPVLAGWTTSGSMCCGF